MNYASEQLNVNQVAIYFLPPNHYLHLDPSEAHLQHRLTLPHLQPHLPLKLLLEVCDPPAVLEHLIEATRTTTFDVLDLGESDPADPETQGGARRSVRCCCGEGGEESEQVSEGQGRALVL
jgi:hypothetical protein